MRRAIPLRPADPSQRVCNYVPDGADQRCGKPAIAHVALELNTDRLSPMGFTCEEDTERVIREFDYADIHPLGGDCGMPGTGWTVPGCGLRSYCKLWEEQIQKLEHTTDPTKEN